MISVCVCVSLPLFVVSKCVFVYFYICKYVGVCERVKVKQECMHACMDGCVPPALHASINKTGTKKKLKANSATIDVQCYICICTVTNN